MKYLKDFEYETLHAHLSASMSQRLTLLELLLNTGMRCEELLSVSLNSIDREGFVSVKGAKGSLDRKVPLDPEFCRKLRIVYASLGGNFPLMDAVSTTSNKLSRKRLLRKIWHETATACGIRLNVHGLRHTFAVRNLRHLSGADALLKLRLIMGHKSINSTVRYLDIIESERLAPGILAAMRPSRVSKEGASL